MLGLTFEKKRLGSPRWRVSSLSKRVMLKEFDELSGAVKRHCFTTQAKSVGSFRFLTSADLFSANGGFDSKLTKGDGNMDNVYAFLILGDCTDEQ